MERAKETRTAILAAAVTTALLFQGASTQGQDAPRKYHAPAVIPLHGRIDLAAAKSFERRIERAYDAKSDLVILDLDVSGGAPDAARIVCEAVRKLGGVRKVGFVPRRALGPGAAAALCCDELYLRPDAVIGDLASVVAGDRVVWLKLLETWSREQHRPPAIIERMAGEDSGRAVLNGREAVAERFADGGAEQVGEILNRLGVGVSPQEFADTWVDEAVSLLNHPVATTALVVTGLVFLYIEVAAAGIGLAALPAAICFLLFFWSKFLGGTAGWLEVILFLAGLICLLVEIFVIPGFGVVGASGIVLVLLSLIMATQGFLLPRTPTDTRLFVQTLIQWAAGTLVFVAAAVAVTRRLGGLPGVKTLVLTPGEIPAATETFGTVPTATSGVAVTDLRPVGKVRLGDRLYDVVTDGFYIPAGSQVRVVEASPNRIQVTRV